MDIVSILYIYIFIRLLQVYCICIYIMYTFNMYTLYIYINTSNNIDMYMYIRISILNIEMRSNNIQNAKPNKANQPTFPERLKKSKQGQTRCQLWVGCGAKPVQNGSFFSRIQQQRQRQQGQQEQQ